jgi:hypothetical protein
MAESKYSQESSASTFESAAEAPARGFLLELFDYLRATKKWWLAPVILALLVVSAFILLGGTAAAPLIYTLF